jgi:hypothetical protein
MTSETVSEILEPPKTAVASLPSHSNTTMPNTDDVSDNESSIPPVPIDNLKDDKAYDSDIEAAQKVFIEPKKAPKERPDKRPKRFNKPLPLTRKRPKIVVETVKENSDESDTDESTKKEKGRKPGSPKRRKRKCGCHLLKNKLILKNNP